jgi:pSer/pThr/pTyr-binding forkhead associated (FHA) protein
MDCGKPLTESAVGTTSPSGGAVPQTRVYAEAGARAEAQCPSCGHAVDPALPFCANCGAALKGAAAAAPAAGGRPCPKCGSPIADAGYKFCPNCATALGPSAAAPAEATAVFSAQRIAQAAIPVTLVHVGEDGQRRGSYALLGEETSIGRAGADLSFADDVYLSPIHALFMWKEGKLSVRDLGSRNGTWVFLDAPHRLVDGDLILIGSQLLRFRRLGYPGPHPPDADATRRMGSLVPSADIASLAQLRADGSVRDVLHLSPGRDVAIGRDRGDWVFPYDPSMSGAHAVIRSEDADFVVHDAGSRNGVALAARGDVQLKKGSKLLVGDKLLVVEIS